jgi:hypothetical protein
MLAQLDCVRCTAAGHRCPSTHTDEQGKPVCVFCLDGEPCPIAKRKALPIVQNLAPPPTPKRKPGRPPAPPRKEKSKMTTKVVTVNDVRPPRTCTAPKRVKDPHSPPCDRPIRPSNKSGFCSNHFYLTKLKRPPVGPIATSTPRAPKGNGNHHRTPTKPSNGHTSQINLSLTEDQLTALFLRLPVVERAAIVSTWLTGGR